MAKRPRTVAEAFAHAKRTGSPYIVRLTGGDLNDPGWVCEDRACRWQGVKATHRVYPASGRAADEQLLCTTHAKKARRG